MNKLENINNRIDELKKEIIKLEENKKSLANFQSIIILNVNTTIKELQNIKNKINNIVELDGKFDEIGLKKLPYEVKKQNEGYYITFYYVAIPEDVANLEKFYRECNNIIKFIDVRNSEY